MGWEGILKGDINQSLKEFYPFYKELIEHPDFDLNMIGGIWGGETRKFLEEIMDDNINLLDSNLNLPLEQQNIMLRYIGRLKGALKRLKEEDSVKRSMELLDGMAKTLGVELIRANKSVVEFRHRGLYFTMQSNRLLINSSVEICVVDKKKLPIGDFYSSLLGLVVVKPQELGVVNFGIQLALIRKAYKHIYPEGIIGIFSPFDRKNAENIAFMTFIMSLEQDKVNSDAPDMLSEIKDALVDCFGSTRGFL